MNGGIAARPTLREVVARRRAGRRRLLELAATWARTLDPALGVHAVVVFGSVARGDWHADSDIDVLVVADGFPAAPQARLAALDPRPPRVEPVAWTPAEHSAHRRRRNPIAVEAAADGVWLVGSPETPTHT